MWSLFLIGHVHYIAMFVKMDTRETLVTEIGLCAQIE